jgi:hypothetical protein
MMDIETARAIVAERTTNLDESVFPAHAELSRLARNFAGSGAFWYPLVGGGSALRFYSAAAAAHYFAFVDRKWPASNTMIVDADDPDVQPEGGGSLFPKYRAVVASLMSDAESAPAVQQA